MNLPDKSQLLPVMQVSSLENQYLALLNSAGRLLIMPLADMPVLSKGKGNILMKCKSSISPEPLVVGSVVVLSQQDVLLLTDKKQTHRLEFKKWQAYIGKRGQTGKTLSKPLTSVKSLAIEH